MTLAAAGSTEPARRPETSVGAVVVRAERLLLIERGRGPATGRWSIPGGRVEWGETLTAAVEREVAEETGLLVTCGPFIGFVEVMGSGSHFVILDFWAEPSMPSTPDLLVAGDDAADTAWVNLDELHQVDLVASLHQFLIDYHIAPPTGTT